MGDGRRPGSGGKEHLGQGGRGPRLKGGMLAAGLSRLFPGLSG